MNDMKAIIKFGLLAVMSTVIAGSLSACGEPTAKVGKTVVSGKADIGGPFSLVNQDGAIKTQDDFTGKPQLIYFGFTYCPDICPTALQKMGAVQATIDKKSDKLNYIFVSVDPERDTPESLKLYVTANGFPNSLTGLTGSQEQIDAAKSAFKVYSQKVETPDSAGDYTVDHSDIIYFMDANGKFLDIFTGRSSVLDISGRVKTHLKSGK